MKVYTESWAICPTRAHATDAGLDLYTPKDAILQAHDSIVINTGVHIRVPHEMYGKIESKSGLNINCGIVSCGGVIDEGYEGAIKVKLYNLSHRTYIFRSGDKIAQLIVQPCAYEDVELCDQSEFYQGTERGSAGFGSTGR